jgi:hypothetical protein
MGRPSSFHFGTVANAAKKEFDFPFDGIFQLCLKKAHTQGIRGMRL